MASGNAILSQAEAQFAGESNEEIRLQLEKQIDSAASVVQAPEPSLRLLVGLLPCVPCRRRRKRRPD